MVVPGRRLLRRIQLAQSPRGELAARVPIVSTMLAPEINEYPDSGKVWAQTLPPGGSRPEDAVDVLVRPDDERPDYLDGER